MVQPFENIDVKVDKAIRFIKTIAENIPELGRYDVDDEFYYMVQNYKTKEKNLGKFESHRNYVDIQYIVSGTENIGMRSINELEIEKEYSSDEDIVFWKTPTHYIIATLTNGSYVVLYPMDGHMPGLCVDQLSDVIKIVGKVKI